MKYFAAVSFAAYDILSWLGTFCHSLLNCSTLAGDSLGELLVGFLSFQLIVQTQNMRRLFTSFSLVYMSLRFDRVTFLVSSTGLVHLLNMGSSLMYSACVLEIAFTSLTLSYQYLLMISPALACGSVPRALFALCKTSSMAYYWSSFSQFLTNLASGRPLVLPRILATSTVTSSAYVSKLSDFSFTSCSRLSLFVFLPFMCAKPFRITSQSTPLLAFLSFSYFSILCRGWSKTGAETTSSDCLSFGKRLCGLA